MNLEEKYFYRAVTALHFLFMIFVINFFYWMAGSLIKLSDYSKDILFAYFLSLIFKESLIYIAYGKEVLFEKWQKSTRKIIRII